MKARRMCLASLARSTSIALLVIATCIAACASEEDASSGADDPASPTRPNPTVPASPEIGPEVAPDGSVLVSHDRELRGAWVVTVHNSNWPSKQGLDQATAKAELIAILDALASARMNTIFFQVRSEADTVYASTIEPWARWLTGKQGQDPGWDPLVFAVEEGHRRGLEVHAWLNPYRAVGGLQTQVAPNHITKMLPSAVRAYNNQLFMDPGVPEVRAHILDVVRDIVQRYDVDGIHFDDYFYPYPVAGNATFDDADTYASYTNAGGMLGKDDWRRSNVDTLIRETSELVAKTRSDVRFGISPFGIYRPGTPAGITGLDAYATIYCDPVKWMDQGWVDYLAPQLYWPTTQTAQAFGKLVTWWAGMSKPGRPIFVGHDATKAGDATWTIAEYEKQMDLVRAERPNGALGSIFFSAKPLVTNQGGLRTALATKHWQLPAATPPIAMASKTPPGAPPKVTTEVKQVTVATNPAIRSIVVYRATSSSGFALDRIVPARHDGPSGLTGTGENRLSIGPGRWAISVVDRRGVESRGAAVTLE